MVRSVQNPVNLGQADLAGLVSLGGLGGRVILAGLVSLGVLAGLGGRVILAGLVSLGVLAGHVILAGLVSRVSWPAPAGRGARLLRHHALAIEPSGTGSQVGRCLASYTTSYTALSSIRARSSAALACGSIPLASA